MNLYARITDGLLYLYLERGNMTERRAVPLTLLEGALAQPVHIPMTLLTEEAQEAP